jgi:integrase
MEHHELMGGKLHVYKRENSRYWQCSTYLGEKNHRKSTKEDSLQLAKEIAEDWYLELRGKLRAGELTSGKKFNEGADAFLDEFEVLTAGERNPRWVKRYKDILRLHLRPFFGEMVGREITSGTAQDYRIHRIKNPYQRPDREPGTAKPPSRSTMHHEIVTLRHVLKTMYRRGWIDFVPDLSMPFRKSEKIVPRPWFSPKEYKDLYTATRKRAKHPPHRRWKKVYEQMHDYVLFMANTGLRPDEARRLQYRDVEIVRDAGTDQTILEIEVRGKRGFGYCKSMPGAVRPFERLMKRNMPEEDDLIFGGYRHQLFNTILLEEGLKFNRDGLARTPYSLRHSYICFRLMEGADVYAIAKNCRTSVEMIEKFYASHIKDMLDATAINVRKPRNRQKQSVQLKKAA